MFTCGAGHIDLAHVRATADWTRYAYKIIYNELTDSKSYILFKTSVDPSIFHIDIKYPENWDSITKESKKNKIHLAAKALAKYLIFNAANWHEILTWYGYSKVRFFSEYPSSFSWEDVFSNIMGIHLVDKALNLNDKDYNLAMTNAIKLEMEDLKMLDRYESIAVTSRVKDLWYKGWVPGLLKMKFRNFDIGYSDGHINPVIVPNNHLCLEQPHPGYKVPTLINANLYGISFKLEIEPKERGSGFEYESKVVGGRIPKEFIPSIEKGILNTFAGGIIAGYPVIDIKVTVLDGSFHPVDSSDVAFQVAGSYAVKDAFNDSQPVILEPLMYVEVEVPESYMGDTISDLNSRRGKIQSIDPDKNNNQHIKAHVPLSEMFGYATALRSVTQGRGVYTMEFFMYSECPKQVYENLVTQKAKGA